MRRSPSNDVPLGGDEPLLLCDWNGTLVDDADRAWLATAAVLRARGLGEIDRAGFAAAFRLPLRDFLADLGIEDDLDGAVELWNDGLLASAPEPSPGAHDLLERMSARGVVVGIVSAAREDVVRSDIEALGLDRGIGFVVAGVESKPTVLTALVAERARAVAYLGDTEYDMRAAAQAGAQAIGYAGGYRPAAALEAAGADAVVRDLAEVERLLP
jgi:phosphoglycolate phosphatase